MAFRIDESVVRGEIDNRVKGKVHGQIWVVGRAEPVILELKGNAWPDLAGCLLRFTNRHKPVTHQHLDSLRAIQRGSIGDLTASRKNRVFDVPLEEAMKMIRRKEKPPEHLANTLYLEWFSEANGRVVVESSDYELSISVPEWRMTAKEEAERSEQAAGGMQGFMAKLGEAIERLRHGQKEPEDEWDEHDYERFLKECDARTDKYAELIDKYGDSEEAEAKIAKEMGWDDDGDETGEARRSVEEMNAICKEDENEPPPEPDAGRQGVDWVRTENGDLRHPLQFRCYESVCAFRRRIVELGIDPFADKDLDQFIFEFQTTGAKLAGALNSIARGEGCRDPAFTVAYLKRALDHLHKSQAGLEGAVPKNLLPEPFTAEARKELFEIREGILRLMAALRGRA